MFKLFAFFALVAAAMANPAPGLVAPAIAPVAYSAPLVHAAPVAYAAPAVVRAAPLAYAAPGYIGAPVVKTAYLG